MYKLLITASAALALLAGCEEQTPENAETEKRIATCQEVMKIYITQGKVYERDRKRLIGTCHISQAKRTLAQWECTLKAMQAGGLLKDASDKCGGGALEP